MTVQIVYFCTAMLAMCGCKPNYVQTHHAVSRSEARAAVTLLQFAVNETYDKCVLNSLRSSSNSLHAICSHSYDAARASLLAAQSLMDEFGDDTSHSVKCSIMDASGSLQNLVGAIRYTGDPIPLSARDAAEFVRAYVGDECRL